MAIYKKDSNYIVKICINGKQILRRKYLGRTIDSFKMATLCEKDLYIRYTDRFGDYEINDLFNLFEDYLFKKYKETSAKRYLYTFNYSIKGYFMNRKVSEITSTYCEFINDSINMLKLKSKRNLIFITKTFILFLSDYGCKVNINKFYVYKESKTNKKEFDYYSLEEFNKLLNVIDENEYKFLFSLLYYYGLRCGELRALQVKDFLKDRLSINKEISNKGRFGGQVILDPKTSSSYRFYPYVCNIKELFNLVIKERKLKKNDFVFKSKEVEGKVIGETTIRRLLSKYANLAHIKVIKIHEFRHSCATYLINEDVDPKDIADWLGHSSIDVTLRYYAHLLPMRKDTVKEIINRKFNFK